MDQPGTAGEPHRPPLGGGPLWLHPDDDLAPNRPGEALLGRAQTAQPPGRLARLLGRGRAEAAEQARLAGQRRFGAGLDGLEALGWRSLHSVPLPGHAQVDHLVIGPGGVFGFRTLHCPGARLRVDEDGVRRLRLGRWVPGEPEVRFCRRAASRSAHALSRALGFAVEVRPVLGLVAPARVARAPGPHDVRLLREAELPAFGALGGILAPGLIETVHTAARDRRTWRDV